MQFCRLQDISVHAENKEKNKCSAEFPGRFERRKEEKAGELTSSVSSPDRGFCCAGPQSAVWCPAALQSVSCTSSSAAALSAAYPHYQPAHQPAAESTITHTYTHLTGDSAAYNSVDWYFVDICRGFRVIQSSLPFSPDAFCSAAQSQACLQTPAGVSFW